MLEELLQRFEAAGLELSLEEVADALWLAPFLPPGAAAVGDVGRSFVGADRVEGPPGEQLSRGQEPAVTGSTPTSQERQPQTAASVTPSIRDLYPRTQAAGLTGPSSRTTPATPVRSPAGRALPDTLALARALRPLMRRVPSKTDWELDEEATADQIAEQRLIGQPVVWTPVLRPTLTRWLEVALVVDASTSMAVWQATAGEFRDLLARQGAFRDVRTWYLDTEGEGEPQLFAAADARRPVHPSPAREPLGSREGRLILLLTDCVAAAWRNQKAFHLLAEWAVERCVVLVQVLPERFWSRTALRRVESLASARIAGVPNPKLVVEPRSEVVLPLSLLGAPSQGGKKTGESPLVPMPIVTLEPAALSDCARMIAGMGRAWVPAKWLVVPSPRPKREVQTDARAASGATAASAAATQPSTSSVPDSRALVATFQATASPSAQKLAGYLASVPLTLPVMRLVQQALLPSSRQVHLAEVLTSGLIRRVSPRSGQTGSPQGREEALTFDFVEGVRDMLRPTVSKSDTLTVLEAVSRFVGAQVGQTGSFGALTPDPLGAETLTLNERTLPFAQVAAEVLDRLGLAYHPAAQRLRERIKSPDPRPILSRRTLQPQQDLIFRFGWSPSGDELAAPTRDGRILLWNATAPEAAEPTSVISVSRFGVNQVAWSPPSPVHLAAACYDHVVRLYAEGGRRPVAELRGHQSDVRTVAWSPDGRQLVSGTQGGSIRFWSAHGWPNWRLERFVNPAAGAVNICVWSPDSVHVACGCDDGTVGICARSDPSRVRRLLGHMGRVTSLCWSPHDRLLISGASDGEIIVWDPDRDEPLVKRFTGHAGPVSGLSVSFDGRILASRSTDGTARFWRADTHALLAVFNQPTSSHTASHIYSNLAFHPQLPLVALLANRDRALSICELDLDALLTAAALPLQDSTDLWLQTTETITPPVPVSYSDPPDEHHGPWVTTRGHHTLDLPPEFRMMAYPVTNELYRRFIDDGGYSVQAYWTRTPPPVREKLRCQDGRTYGPSTWSSSDGWPAARAHHPVAGVCYLEALAFSRWLQEKHPPQDADWRWCLPTEDIWEFAARSEAGFAYPWGTEFLPNRCNSAEARIGTTTDVQGFPEGTSRAGCHEMAGNVWEFVATSGQSDPTCILRGGSYQNNQYQIRSYLRLGGVPPDHRPPDFGFRCAQVRVDLEQMSDPSVRIAVARYTELFQNATRQVRILRTCKIIHDILHDLQETTYKPPLGASDEFPSRELARDFMLVYERELRDAAVRVRNQAESDTPHQSSIESLAQQLQETAEMLTAANTQQNRDPLEKALDALQRLITLQPTKFNTYLNEAAHQIAFPELMDTLERIGATIFPLSIPDAVFQKKRFRAGVAVFASLDRRLKALVEEHDRWQKADDALRRIESSRSDFVRQLPISWPAVKGELDLLCQGPLQRGTSTPEWADQLAHAVSQVTAALNTFSSGQASALQEAFAHLRQMAAVRFYNVDKQLMRLCDELSTMEDPIRSLPDQMVVIPDLPPQTRPDQPRPLLTDFHVERSSTHADSFEVRIQAENAGVEAMSGGVTISFPDLTAADREPFIARLPPALSEKAFSKRPGDDISRRDPTGEPHFPATCMMCEIQKEPWRPKEQVTLSVIITPKDNPPPLLRCYIRAWATKDDRWDVIRDPASEIGGDVIDQYDLPAYEVPVRWEALVEKES
jgi:WD40 repeat protein/formylglycine-generating enzyme required for sulfatase activity